VKEHQRPFFLQNRSTTEINDKDDIPVPLKMRGVLQLISKGKFYLGSLGVKGVFTLQIP